MSRSRHSHRVIDTFALLSVVVFIGMCSKYYQGMFRSWVNNSFTGVVYVIFWCMFFSLPGMWKPRNIAIGVFIVTCLIEFLQLLHTPFLASVRSTFLGGVMVGTVFQWSDFPYYAMGCFFGYLIIRALAKS